MKPWQPDRKQWRVIWTVYAVAFLCAVGDWFDTFFDEGRDPGPFIGFVVIAGVLIVWRLQGACEKPEVKAEITSTETSGISARGMAALPSDLRADLDAFHAAVEADQGGTIYRLARWFNNWRQRR